MRTRFKPVTDDQCGRESINSIHHKYLNDMLTNYGCKDARKSPMLKRANQRSHRKNPVGFTT